MDRKRLLGKLHDALKIEEAHIPMVADFYSERFDWSGFEEDAIKKVKKIFMLIKEQTETHEKMVREMISWVMESESDDI